MTKKMKITNLDILSNLSSFPRLEILTHLESDSMKTAQLAKKMKTTIQGIQRHIDRLSSTGLVEKNNDGVISLSPIGQISLQQLQTFQFISKHKKYFGEHTFGDIPQKMSLRVGNLATSQFLDGIAPNFTRWKKTIKDADEYLYCIFTQPPILIADTILKKIPKGLKIKLLFGENSIISYSNEFVQKLELSKSQSYDKYEMRITEQVLVNLVMTEKNASLMFPYRNQTTDMHKSFVSSDADFHEWCLDFFKHKWYDAIPLAHLKTGHS